MRAIAWMEAHQSDVQYISYWTITEFSAAMSAKLRNKEVSANRRADALARFGAMTAKVFTVLPVATAQFHAAAQFADNHELVIRSGDALHLAICAEYQTTLCTMDRRLAVAGPALGIMTQLV